jgi:hypothetical protein
MGSYSPTSMFWQSARPQPNFDRYWASASSYPVDRIVPPVGVDKLDELERKALTVERDPAAGIVATERKPIRVLFQKHLWCARPSIHSVEKDCPFCCHASDPQNRNCRDCAKLRLRQPEPQLHFEKGRHCAKK